MSAGLARIALRAIGLAGLLFGFSFVPLGGDELETVARKIVRGQHFAPAALAAEIAAHPTAGDACNPDDLRNLTIIQAEITDAAMASGDDVAAVDAATGALEAGARRFVACSPRETLGWLMLYWTRTRLGGLGPEAIEFLARSYRFGPREAWVAVRRNVMAIGVLRRLPEPLQAAALREFAGLLELQIFDSPIASLAAAPPGVRQDLYRAAAALPEATRIKLAIALRARGLPADALGLPVQPARPWRQD